MPKSCSGTWRVGLPEFRPNRGDSRLGRKTPASDKANQQRPPSQVKPSLGTAAWTLLGDQSSGPCWKPVASEHRHLGSWQHSPGDGSLSASTNLGKICVGGGGRVPCFREVTWVPCLPANEGAMKQAPLLHCPSLPASMKLSARGTLLSPSGQPSRPGQTPALVPSPTAAALALLCAGALGIWAGLDGHSGITFRVSVWTLHRWHLELMACASWGAGGRWGVWWGRQGGRSPMRRRGGAGSEVGVRRAQDGNCCGPRARTWAQRHFTSPLLPSCPSCVVRHMVSTLPA